MMQKGSAGGERKLQHSPNSHQLICGDTDTQPKQPLHPQGKSSTVSEPGILDGTASQSHTFLHLRGHTYMLILSPPPGYQ